MLLQVVQVVQVRVNGRMSDAFRRKCALAPQPNVGTVQKAGFVPSRSGDMRPGSSDRAIPLVNVTAIEDGVTEDDRATIASTVSTVSGADRGGGEGVRRPWVSLTVTVNREKLPRMGSLLMNVVTLCSTTLWFVEGYVFLHAPQVWLGNVLGVGVNFLALSLRGYAYCVPQRAQST